jgi:hypothetical protein
VSLPLEDVAGRARPVTLAEERVLPVLEPLAELFPGGGMRRGSTVMVDSICGTVSLALALAAAASQAGSWIAAVGSWCAELGLVAAAELGVCLERFALVPDPGSQWPAVMAALLDAIDVVMVGGTVTARMGDVRRLGARARERGAVLIVLGSAWPERTDLRLTVATPRWRGVGQGCGHLQARQVEVVATGRGAASRRRSTLLWLPGERGQVEAVEAIEAVGGATAGHGDGVPMLRRSLGVGPQAGKTTLAG